MEKECLVKNDAVVVVTQDDFAVGKVVEIDVEVVGSIAPAADIEFLVVDRSHVIVAEAVVD